MILASDLDRTLIYSAKFLEGFSGRVKAAETGRYYSYMTETAAELLKYIAGRVLFVPCTTRTIEQYLRIDFFQSALKPAYAITSNGANLIRGGVVDTGYRDMVSRLLNHRCAAGHDVLKEFDRLAGDEWAQPMREADGVFYYCIIERKKIPSKELAAFGNWAREQKWEVSLQGRKLYLVPQVINKRAALTRVIEMTGENSVIAAGDSLLDLPLLQGADYALIPAHGELYEQLECLQENWLLTASSGLPAGEEILQAVIKIVNENQTCGGDPVISGGRMKI